MSTNSRAKARFRVRVEEWAGKLQVVIQAIAVRPMKNKWASYSTSGRLTFDATLLDLPSRLQDYVIVHELLHFSVPNHGKLWKSLMRAHLGEYERRETELKRIAQESGRSSF